MLRERSFLITSALLFLASAAATVGWCGSMACGMSMAWMRMSGQTWPQAAASFLAMWLLMMVAMMLPSLVPMLSTYRRSVRASDEPRLGALTLVAGAGYFLVWAAVGAAAYPLGVATASAAMRFTVFARALPVAAAVVVVAAGCLQLTAWKSRQLARCREEPDCCRRLRGDVGVAFRHGIHLGVHCSRCCLPFTLVLLATDVMSLGVMAAVTVGITLERLAPRPERVARILGVLILAAATALFARAVTST